MAAPTTNRAEHSRPEGAAIAVAERARRRITRRLMPFLICLFVVAFAVSAGPLLSAMASRSVGLAVAMFCLAGAGLYAYLPGFWALPTAFLTESAAAAVGLINSVGNLGGFVGPYFVGYLGKRTGLFYAGVVYLSCSALASACLVLSVRHSSKRN